MASGKATAGQCAGRLFSRRGNFCAGELNRACGAEPSPAAALLPDDAEPRCFCRLRCAPAEKGSIHVEKENLCRLPLG